MDDIVGPNGTPGSEGEGGVEGWSQQPVSAVSRRSADSVLQRRLSLTDLLDIQSFTEQCKSFVDLYRIGLKVFDETGQKLVDIKIGNGDFCGYVFTFSGGNRACSSTVRRIKDGPATPTDQARLPEVKDAPRGTVVVQCFTGARYLMLPLVFDGDTLGRVVFGPFVPDDLKELPRSLLDTVGSGFDVAKGVELMNRIRRAPETTVTKVLGHFLHIIEALVIAGQKVYITSNLHIEATRESFRDLERKNKELQSANDRLRDLDRLKSAFLATVSHELRTPLTSIIGYSEMMAHGMAGPLTSEQAEYVKTIMEKGESLLSLITSILDITQIEAGRVRLAFQATDVSDLVRASATAVLPQAQKKGVSVITEPTPTDFPKPQIDREKVRQCIVNLLGNAVKFTPPGGRVTASVRRLQPDETTGELTPSTAFAIVVADTGVGIPPDQHDKIFETFYQVDSSSTREFGGAGLGLAIVKNFVAAHGGAVRVTSQVGKGSQFTMMLPFTPRPPEQPIRAPF